MEELPIIQHNVLKWTNKRANELYNIYMKFSPHIILLNATGRKQEEPLKIYGYNIHRKNISNEDHSGIAIAIQRHLRYKILDNTTNDVLAIEIDTLRGPVIVCTAYLPPRRPLFPYQDLLPLIRKNLPVYIIGDLNARHSSLGHTTNNAVGNAVNNLINRNLITHLGPEFKTWISPIGSGTPDIVLANQHAHYNIAIKQGPLTSSDHLPVIIKLSTKPILISGNKRYKIEEADWAKFKKEIQGKVNTITTQEEIGKAQIDKMIEQWHNIVIEAMERAIPKRNITTLPHPKETELQKQLQCNYNRLKEIGDRNGWTMVERNMFKALQNLLIEECTKNYYSNWKNLISNIEMKRNEPKEFWGNIQRIMGSKEEQSLYLKDNQGNKIFTKGKNLFLDKSGKRFFRSHQKRTDFFAQSRREKWKIILEKTQKE